MAPLIRTIGEGVAYFRWQGQLASTDSIRTPELHAYLPPSAKMLVSDDTSCVFCSHVWDDAQGYNS